VAEYTALILGLYIISQHLKLTTADLINPALWDRERLLNLFSVNANLFIRTLCLIASFYWLTIASSHQGAVLLAANTILIQLLHVMAHGLDGFSHAAESLGGQAFGNKDKHQFVTSVRICAEWGLVFAMFFSIFYALTGPYLVQLMTDIPAVVELALVYMPWIALAPLISIASFLLDGIFIGVTHTREMRNGMIISLVVFLLSSWVLTQLFANHGLWAAYLVLMLCRGLTLSLSFPRILRHF